MSAELSTRSSSTTTVGPPPSGPDGPQSSFSTQASDDASVNQMVFILDRQDSSPGIERLRRWALDLAAPAPGEVAVDVGSGTGTMTRRLGRSTGGAVGLEPNPALRAIAVQRAADEGEKVEFVDGTAAQLPFGDGTVDLIWCERVLQHVADPAGAIREMARALRPGGRAVLLDSDHATRLMSGIDPVTESALRDFFLTRAPNARAARDIPTQVLAAGLLLDGDIGSSALVFPLDGVMARGFVAMMGPAAIASGAVTAEQMATALSTIEADGAAGHAFTAVTVFGFIARKPTLT
jgi:SAM-dependent methyltransferase